ncbi:MAG: hypothetical protein ACLFVO_26765 [Chloroflexaceae bacterium]
MRTTLVTPTYDLRIWRDEQLGKIWRVAYNDGEAETVISFPDTAALGDFIAEQLGLNLLDTQGEQDPTCSWSWS